jgi:hypothetical protein
MNKLDLILALGVFVLSFCSAPIAEGQGIQGIVLLGPNCPVMQEGVPCPDTPFQTELVVTSADGTRDIKHFFSNADGEFEVSLPVGTYGIRSVDVGGLPYCSTNEPVIVLQGEMTETTVFCDTGIR